jgi:hypothetical protein
MTVALTNKLGLLVVVLLALLIVSTVLFFQQEGFDRLSISSYNEIKKGMTKTCVFELLGPPSDNTYFLIPIQGTAPPPQFEADLPGFVEILKGTWKNWIRKEFAIEVIFDANDKVIGKGLIKQYHGNLSQ